MSNLTLGMALVRFLQPVLGPADPLLVGLAQHFTMENVSGSTLVDETGGYDGTLVGTPTQVDGVIGQALRIEMSDSIQHSLPSLSTWTVAGWVNLVSGSEYSHLLTFSSDQGQGALKIGDDGFSNNLYFYKQSTGSKTTNFQVPKGVWSFFLAKFDGSTLTIRLNDSRQTFSGTAWTLPSGTYICGTYTGGSSAERSDIILDQRRVYSRAVSQAEEDALYAELPVPTNGLIADYDPANITGSTLPDEAGNADITIYGATPGQDGDEDYLGFDGNDYAVSASAPSHPLSDPSVSGALTVAMRLYCTGGNYILSTGAQTSSRGISIMNLSPAWIGLKDGSQSWQVNPSQMPQNQWFTLLMEWDGVSLSVEYDDAVAGNDASPGAESLSNERPKIALGCPNSALGQYEFAGNIGRVRGYSRVFSRAEKDALKRFIEGAS